MDSVLRDLRVAARGFWRRPSFTFAMLVTLALGIGATTAIFSVVQAVVLRPLPYWQPENIAAVDTYWLKRGEHGPVSAPDFHDLHDQNRTFAALASFQALETSIGIGGDADYALVVRVAPEFFRAVGFAPQRGRVLSDDEARDGARSAVVTDAFWRSHLGGDPRAVGSMLAIGQRTYEIVGVLQAGLRYPAAADIYISAANGFQVPGRGGHVLRLIGRLRPGVTIAQAQGDLSAIAQRLERQYPATNEAKSFAVVSLQDSIVGDARLTLYVLLAAVGFVLLIATVNVANLLLARGTAREREMVVRAAIGATRGRLVGQLLTESALLGIAAAGVGIVLARVGIATLVRMAPESLPRLDEVTIDSSVFLFALALAVVASLMFGAAPAIQMSRVRLADKLSSGNKGTIGGRGTWLRNVLVVSEIAFAVVLVTGAVLLGRSLAELTTVKLGYSTEHLLAIRTAVPIGGLADLPRAASFYRELLPSIRTLPGVSAAGATLAPATMLASNGGYTIEGRPPGGINGPKAVFSVVTPGYFRAMRIPVIRGREFDDGDRLESPFVAVISESLARAAFPDDNPLGRRIQSGFDSPKFMTIVGVAGDVRTGGPDKGPQPEIYMPAEQHQVVSALTVVVRTDSVDPAALGATIARHIRQRNPAVPVRVRLMEDLVSTTTATPRLRTFLVGTFAIVALLLACAGIYGVMAFGVSQRVSEIGVRIALGATSRDVFALVMRRGIRLTIGGLAIGFVLALLASRLIAGLLFAVTPYDPATLALTAALIAATALFACYVPAAVATRISPVAALRAE